MADFKEKYEKLEKAVRAVFKCVDERTWNMGVCRLSAAYRELKAALEPSREERMDKLEDALNEFHAGTKQYEAITWAIEELEKDAKV